jgi:hypothetical protein
MGNHGVSTSIFVLVNQHLGTVEEDAEQHLPSRKAIAYDNAVSR